MLPKIQELPYIRADGKAKKATVIPVNFSLEGLTDEEILVIGHLSKASDGMTPIFAQQNYDKALDMFGALLVAETRQRDTAVRRALNSYNTLFAAGNSPWEYTSGLGFRFPLHRDSISTFHPLAEFIELLMHGFQAPPGRGLYPVGITNPEIDGLEDSLRVNSSIAQNLDGSLRVILHEERYKNDLEPVIAEIKRAKNITSNKSLQKYLAAKVDELRTGSLEAREASNHAWLNLNGSIDFIIGTGTETYLDKVRGVRGVAQASVCRVNNKYQDFSDSFLGMLQDLEQRTPWEHKKKIDASNTPRLRFVDVATWSGDYDPFPTTTLAQSLPNEQDFKERYGSVNLVFANVQEAVGKAGDQIFIRDEFMPKSIIGVVWDQIYSMRLIMSAAHEISHASGGVVIDADPKHCFGKEYTRMEEARAELFSMWALPILVEKGIINQTQEIAGYYSMVFAMIRSLQEAPHDHAGSRNMMFNYFIEKGALVEREEDGKLKYGVNAEIMRAAVTEMLKTIANIRATGDKEGLEKFKSQYLSEARKGEFEKRLEAMPQGRLLIFPTIKMNGDRYTRDLAYPLTFMEQTRTLNNFV